MATKTKQEAETNAATTTNPPAADKPQGTPTPTAEQQEAARRAAQAERDKAAHAIIATTTQRVYLYDWTDKIGVGIIRACTPAKVKNQTRKQNNARSLAALPTLSKTIGEAVGHAIAAAADPSVAAAIYMRPAAAKEEGYTLPQDIDPATARLLRDIVGVAANADAAVRLAVDAAEDWANYGADSVARIVDDLITLHTGRDVPVVVGTGSILPSEVVEHILDGWITSGEQRAAWIARGIALGWLKTKTPRS